MLAVLDVHGLKKDQIQFLQQLVEFMRHNALDHQVVNAQKTPINDLGLLDETETIKLRSFQLGVKGEVSREEIYDYLDEQ